jgi:predicted enzyme related to lactoylglutathione lyase
MLKKIAYSSYPVLNMKRAVDFYQHVLGFQLLFQQEDWAEFEIDGQRLALQKVQAIAPPVLAGGAIISFHSQSIEKDIRSLKSKNVAFIGNIQTYPYGKIAYFKDPDSNILGLYEPPPKVTP